MRISRLKLAFCLFLLVIVQPNLNLASGNPPNNRADQIIGVWELESKESRIEIFKKDNRYFGKLLWGKDVVEADGITSKKDIKNPDPKLRDRDILGIIFIQNLQFKDDKYKNGSIYDAGSGRTYKCICWIKDGRLFLKGYLGIPFLGKTVKWHRLQKSEKKVEEK